VPAILVVTGFAFVFVGFFRRSCGLRLSLLYASIPVSLFIAFITEILSAFHAITKPWLLFVWAVFVVAAYLWMRRQNAVQPVLDGPTDVWKSLSRSDRWIVGALAALFALIATTALLSAPNTWDAMEYHMPRVVEWITNHGVQLYPTIDRQQLSMPPFSEYVILHLHLLEGSDRFANLVQWLAYVGSTIAVSLIAREFGAGMRVQIFAAVIAGTVETGVLGASGTKNDYTLAYWIAVSILLLLQWSKRQDWLLALAIGSAFSLSVFSKGTSYVFLPPLLLACFFMWDRKAQKQLLLRLPVLALLCLAMNGPLWARNHDFSGSILGLPYFDGAGPNEARMYGNGHITPARSLANVIRSVDLHLATPVRQVNALTVKASSSVIRTLGVDPSDPSQLVLSQLGYLPPFNIEFHPFSETQSGNQLHFALLMLALILCLWKWRSINKDILLFGLGIAGSFILYASLLRWSPWNARYQLPIFVLAAVFTAVVLGKFIPRWITAISICLLLIAAVLDMRIMSRPLIDRKYSIMTSPRERTYLFDNHWFYADSYIQTADAVERKECNSIGIDANVLHYEYPMMALVNLDGKQRKLSYVAVHNSTARYKQASVPEPCVVICLDCAASKEKEQFQQQFQTMETYGGMLVFSNPNHF
jgi:4-amino-4-deoxy-L-arabinose transferase-like glycosyltransferase